MTPNKPHMDPTTIQTTASALIALITTAYGIYQKIMAHLANKQTTAAEQAKTTALAAKDKAEAEAAIKTAEYQTLTDLMNPYTPQTPEQTALLQTGTIPDATWKMNPTTIEDLSKHLTAAGGHASLNVVKAVVTQAEKDKQVEYAILCTPTDGTRKPIDEYPAAFITYGTIAKIDTWKTIKDLAHTHHCTDWYSIAG